MDLSQKRVSFIRFYVLFLLVYFLVFIGNGPSVRSCSFACTGGGFGSVLFSMLASIF